MFHKFKKKNLVMESFRRMWLLSRKRKNVNDELEMDFLNEKRKDQMKMMNF